MNAMKNGIHQNKKKMQFESNNAYMYIMWVY